MRSQDVQTFSITLAIIALGIFGEAARTTATRST